jgi:hypothetical protein
MAKNGDQQPSLWSEKFYVYSYAMACNDWIFSPWW